MTDTKSETLVAALKGVPTEPGWYRVRTEKGWHEQHVFGTPGASEMSVSTFDRGLIPVHELDCLEWGRRTHPSPYTSADIARIQASGQARLRDTDAGDRAEAQRIFTERHGAERLTGGDDAARDLSLGLLAIHARRARGERPERSHENKLAAVEKAAVEKAAVEKAATRAASAKKKRRSALAVIDCGSAVAPVVFAACVVASVVWFAVALTAAS